MARDVLLFKFLNREAMERLSGFTGQFYHQCRDAISVACREQAGHTALELTVAALNIEP
jgi:hypothetical protein